MIRSRWIFSVSLIRCISRWCRRCRNGWIMLCVMSRSRRKLCSIRLMLSGVSRKWLRRLSSNSSRGSNVLN